METNPQLQSLIEELQSYFDEEQFLQEPNELYEPIEYTLRLGGKRLRPLLLLAATRMFSGDTSDARYAAIGIELFHNFTLLHDDLMDRSPLRRGQPTVYKKWGDNTAILSGDTMFAMAWQYFLRYRHPRMYDIFNCFNETAIGVCQGQQYDMNFERMDNVSVEDYMKMINLKTAVLIAGALKIGALYANAPFMDIERVYRFGTALGLAFQLQDDLLDSFGDTSVLGKQTCQDIRDNKKNYVYLKALEMASEQQREELKSMFSPSFTDTEAKVARTLELYEQIGVRSQVEQAIEEQFNRADLFLNSIDVWGVAKGPLREISRTLLGRKK